MFAPEKEVFSAWSKRHGKWRRSRRPMKHMRMSSRAYDGEPRAACAPRLNAAKQRGAAPQKPAQMMHLDELEAHLAQLPPQPKARRRVRARALSATSDVRRPTSDTDSETDTDPLSLSPPPARSGARIPHARASVTLTCTPPFRQIN